jgi:hypothetical protein
VILDLAVTKDADEEGECVWAAMDLILVARDWDGNSPSLEGRVVGTLVSGSTSLTMVKPARGGCPGSLD